MINVVWRFEFESLPRTAIDLLGGLLLRKSCLAQPRDAVPFVLGELTVLMHQCSLSLAENENRRYLSLPACFGKGCTSFVNRRGANKTRTDPAARSLEMEFMKFLLLTVLLSSSIAIADENTCMSKAQSHVEQDQCQAAQLDRLDNALNAIYPAALSALPNDDVDSRKNQEQLRKSQRAWLAYVQENCTLEGALEGGSGAWVSTFSVACKIEAFRKRIAYLTKIACQSRDTCTSR